MSAIPQTQLDPNITFAWIFGRFFRFILITLPMTALSMPLLIWMFKWKVALVLAGIYLTYHLIFALIWPVLEYRFFRYDVREKDFLVQQGVLFRRSSAIPLHRIQHIDTHQGPIDRLLGLSTLLLYTASGVTADGTIPGLTESDAQELRDALSRREGDDGV
jgi:membrane protein YdbS with pleckstrin-like domain